MKPPVEVTVPVSVLVTTTFFAPAVPEGVIAVIEVELATTTPVAGVPSIDTGNVHTHMAVFRRIGKCRYIWQKQLRRSG